MQIAKLHNRFDKLQLKFGDNKYNAVYGAGETKNPFVCFVFMNPTARNISSEKNWKGLRAPWLGTKNIWKLFEKIGVISDETFKEISKKKPKEWTEKFCLRVYKEIKLNKCFVTNLAKCTQVDARPLKNQVFIEYLPIVKQEIMTLNPKIIITFGNQVSSILLSQNINVSKNRTIKSNLCFDDKKYDVYPTYYPVGQGMRNMALTAKDIKKIFKQKKIILQK